MKLLKFIAVVLLLSGMVSCGIQRELEESRETDAHYHTSYTDSSYMEERIRSVLMEIMTEKASRLTVQEMTSRKEILSPPDSSGKQYVIERSETLVRTDISEQKDISSHLQRTDTTESHAMVVATENVMAEKNEKSVIEDSKGQAWWQAALMWIGISVLVVFAMKLIWK